MENWKWRIVLAFVLLMFAAACDNQDNSQQVEPVQKKQTLTVESIQDKIDEIKNLRAALLAKQKEFEETRTHYENQIEELKDELIKEQNRAGADTFEQAITDNRIRNRLGNISECDAYLQEIRRRTVGISNGEDDLLTLTRSFEAKSRMIESMSEEEAARLVRQVNVVIAKYLPEANKLVIDKNLVKFKSKKQIWEEIKAEQAKLEEAKRLKAEDERRVEAKKARLRQEDEAEKLKAEEAKRVVAKKERLRQKAEATKLKAERLKAEKERRAEAKKERLRQKEEAERLKAEKGERMKAQAIAKKKAEEEARIAKTEAIAKKKAFQPELNRQVWQEICDGIYDRYNELTELSPVAANCLSKGDGERLSLNNLTTLSPEAARCLAQWKGARNSFIGNEFFIARYISLDGLKTLSPETAKHLATWIGESLYLNGLTTLSPETAKHLGQWRGESLNLNGLTTLSPYTAKHLGDWGNWEGQCPKNLCLYSVKKLSTKAIKNLSKLKVGNLNLNNLTSLNREEARSLSISNIGTIRLRRITRSKLSKEAKIYLKHAKPQILFNSEK